MRNGCTHKTRAGFTLAELLVVLVIIGILFAIILPSLNTVAGQSKLDGAANAVHAAAKLARQYAVTQNQPTYLVFNEGQTDSNLTYRAYAVFTINIHTNVINQSAGYFLTEWESLPVGVVFDNQASVGSRNVLIQGIGGWSGGFDRQNRLLIRSDDYPVLGFKPQGSQHRNIDSDIQLAEGFYDAGSLVRTSDQGKRIRIDSMGESHITSVLYDESGEPQEIVK